jgi:hypothetical protein
MEMSGVMIEGSLASGGISTPATALVLCARSQDLADMHESDQFPMTESFTFQRFVQFFCDKENLRVTAYLLSDVTERQAR